MKIVQKLWSSRVVDVSAAHFISYEVVPADVWCSLCCLSCV